MRTASKKLAFVLALVMAFSMLPMMVSAGAATITGVVVKGETVTGADKDAMKTYDDFFTDLAAATFTVNLTQEELDSTTLVNVVAAASTTDTEAVIMTSTADKAILAGTYDDAADFKTEVTNTSTTGISELLIGSDATALTPGTVIWIVDGTDADAAYMRVIINQTGDNTVGGDSTVNNPIFNVRLPMDLDFKVDPLQLGDVVGNDSQLSRQAYIVVNKSNAPVKVAVAVEVKEKDNTVVIVDTREELDNGLTHGQAPADGNKHAFVSVVAANSFTISADPSASTATDSVSDFSGNVKGLFNYDTSVDGTVFPVPATTGDSIVEFALVLGKATGPDNGELDALAANDAGIASFSLMGELDTYAAWASNDLTVEGTFKLQGVKTTDYATTTTVGLNVLGEGSGSTHALVFTAPGQKTLEVANRLDLVSADANDTPMKVYTLYFTQKPAEFVMMKNIDSNGTYTKADTLEDLTLSNPAKYYYYDAETGIMHVNAAPGTSGQSIYFQTDTGDGYVVRYVYGG